MKIDFSKYKPLMKAATEARKNAYCAFTKFPVGAAVLTTDGRIFQGCNVEDPVCSLSSCAERVAIFNAVSHGARKIEAVAVTCKHGTPCGACRQVISSFAAPQAILILMNDRKGGGHRTRWFWTKSLLPESYSYERSRKG